MCQPAKDPPGFTPAISEARYALLPGNSINPDLPHPAPTSRILVSYQLHGSCSWSYIFAMKHHGRRVPPAVTDSPRMHLLQMNRGSLLTLQGLLC